jgi:glycosyltransferase involved in cell wall biosynthesis
VRALQFRPHFERSTAWQAAFISRKSERLNTVVNRTFRPAVPLVVPLVHRPVFAYARRWERHREDEIVRQAAAVDLVYLVKMSHLPLYERLRKLNGPKVVMDFNDGLWLRPFQFCGGWNDLNAILAVSHGVICENSYVADYARRYNECVCVVPDSPQVELFDRWRGQIRRDPAQVVIGWLGSPENVGALYRILEPLEALCAEYSHLRLRVVGSGGAYLPRFENVRWSSRPSYNQEEMVQETLRFDVGVFPMFHNGDGLARGSLKAMVYMSAQAAALCENYGENPKLIQDGVNGALAFSPDEWFQKIQWLATDLRARQAIARRGLETIRDRFSTGRVFAQLEAAFDHILGAEVKRTPGWTSPAIA